MGSSWARCLPVSSCRNFGSDRIQEDNFIGQLSAQGFNLTFLGDDTWMVDL